MLADLAGGQLRKKLPVVAIVAAAVQVDDAPAPAGRVQVGDNPRRGLATGPVAVQQHRHLPAARQLRPLALPRVILGHGNRGQPRDRALIMSRGPATSTTHRDRSAAA